jgi:uncharacterized membrane protein
MKKISLFALAVVIAGSILSCKKTEEAVVIPKLTYEKDIKPILVLRCTPCHLAAGTNPNKWDTYAATQAKAATILDRIQRAPGATGFMPRNGTAQIPADEIAKIKQWVTDGTLEK